VRAQLDGDTILVGNEKWMAAQGIGVGYFRKTAEKQMEGGRTVLYVAKNGKAQGIIAMADTIRTGAVGVVEWFQANGVTRQVLLSGDEEPIVRSVARELGLDAYEASILPEEKARAVADLMADGKRVLMVGDGVNDALALSEATVGVAMGAGGSEAAIESADIALAGNDLEDLVTLRLLSRATLRTIEQNFWLANTTNLLGILLAVTGRLSPMLAGFLHVGHTLGILLNSGRLVGWAPTGLILRSREAPTEPCEGLPFIPQ
jgi:cation-transporting P-type ATPase C